MILNTDPEYEKQKALEEKLARTEEEQKEELLAELKKESASVICLAVMYAKGFEQTGENITERWDTAEKQIDVIQRKFNEGYRAGFTDGIKKGKEIEREENVNLKNYDFASCEFVEITTPLSFKTIENNQYKRKNPTKKRHKRK